MFHKFKMLIIKEQHGNLGHFLIDALTRAMECLRPVCRYWTSLIFPNFLMHWSYACVHDSIRQVHFTTAEHFSQRQGMKHRKYIIAREITGAVIRTTGGVWEQFATDRRPISGLYPGTQKQRNQVTH